jgi:hypothetical protein
MVFQKAIKLDEETGEYYLELSEEEANALGLEEDATYELEFYEDENNNKHLRVKQYE